MLRMLLLAVLGAGAAAGEPDRRDFGKPWERHIVDDASKGADGVKLADTHGDGLLDIATGWEEGAEIRVCLNPGPAQARLKWPAVRVGKVRDPEDAVFVDLDGDGSLDVVSCCEGKTRTVYLHFGPKDKGKCLDEQAWTTVALPASVGLTRWMFCVPAQVDGKYGLDLICGSKETGGQIGWFESPQDPRKADDWRWHSLRAAGWVMSLVWVDMNGDGQPDILFSDRYGPRRGVYWLENPGRGADLARPWKEHAVGATDREAMFLTQADLDGDGLRDVIVPAKPKDLLWLRRLDKSGDRWETRTIRIPEESARTKGVNAADLDGDGCIELVFSCEGAGGGSGRSGIMWLKYRNAPTDQAWEAHDIAGTKGIKYDLVELIDMDGDGDLDVLTTEEREINAVVWYENPAK